MTMINALAIMQVRMPGWYVGSSWARNTVPPMMPPMPPEPTRVAEQSALSIDLEYCWLAKSKPLAPRFGFSQLLSHRCQTERGEGFHDLRVTSGGVDEDSKIADPDIVDISQEREADQQDASAEEDKGRSDVVFVTQEGTQVHDDRRRDIRRRNETLRGSDIEPHPVVGMMGRKQAIA